MGYRVKEKNRVTNKKGADKQVRSYASFPLCHAGVLLLKEPIGMVSLLALAQTNSLLCLFSKAIHPNEAAATQPPHPE
jgi:hypothetical protein